MLDSRKEANCGGLLKSFFVQTFILHTLFSASASPYGPQNCLLVVASSHRNRSHFSFRHIVWSHRDRSVRRMQFAFLQILKNGLYLLNFNLYHSFQFSARIFFFVTASTVFSLFEFEKLFGRERLL